MKSDVKTATGAAGFLSLIGLAQTGATGAAFLVEPIPVPLWFILAAVSLPTGELLAALRASIYSRTGAKRRRERGD